MIKDRVSEYLDDKGYLSWWNWVNNENIWRFFTIIFTFIGVTKT